MKFKSDIEVQAGLKDSSGAVGTSGQVLSSTASGVSWITQSISGYVPYTGATANVNLGAYSITADSFIKIGGTADQYLKADGSVSTAMNSRIEADFVATSGQTTFVTPYEVGQIDVYYNGSKLYPNEFTATNGTDVVLAQAATLGAQISIIKYVSSFTTTSIRNESTFTTTAGQTTFAVNYSPGQVDVFYNGSKLNISEFTATNGTSVVLGFACAAGESIVIDSYVNQVSGASGTANKVAKFTGSASLGDSQIFDNGATVSVGVTPSPWFSFSKAIDIGAGGAIQGRSNTAGTFELATNSFLNSSGNWVYKASSVAANLFSMSNGSYAWNLAPSGTAGNAITFTQAMTLNTNGNVLVGTTTDNGNRLQVNGNSSFSGNVGIGTTSPAKKLHVKGGNDDVLFLDNSGERYTTQYFANNGTTKSFLVWDNTSSLFEIGTAVSADLRLLTNNAERMRITSGGNVGIGTTSPTNYTGYRTLSLNNTSGAALELKVNDATALKVFSDNAQSYLYESRNMPLWFATNSAERMRITSGGNVCIGTASETAGGSVVRTHISGADFGLGISVNGSGSQQNIRFVNGTTAVGSVVTTSSTTTYNTISDYRLKQDLKPINGLDLVSQIKVYDYEWKVDQSRAYGVLAHELQEVIPQAVNGQKDEKEMQSVDYSKLVPILIQAIQELKEEIERISAKV